MLDKGLSDADKLELLPYGEALSLLQILITYIAKILTVLSCSYEFDGSIFNKNYIKLINASLIILQRDDFTKFIKTYPEWVPRNLLDPEILEGFNRQMMVTFFARVRGDISREMELINAKPKTPEPQIFLFLCRIQDSLRKHIEQQKVFDKGVDRDNDSLIMAMYGSPNIRNGKTLEIRLKKCVLKLDPKTGDVWLSKKHYKLNPRRKSFQILYKLAISDNYQASYEDLIGESYTKAQKNAFTVTIKDLKRDLEILPKSKNSNTDIIQSMRGYGYKLLTY